MGVVGAKLGNNMMKWNFLEWPFDFMHISQNRNHVFFLRSTFVISNFDQKLNLQKIIFFMHIFKGIFFLELQAERRAFGPKNSQKTTCKDQHGILMKIFNEKCWPQREYVFCNLRKFEKVKSKLEKIEFRYVVSYF